jgi:hypothetical protein
MGRQMLDGWQPALFALGGFVLLYFVKANPVLLIAASGMLGYLVYGRTR